MVQGQASTLAREAVGADEGTVEPTRGARVVGAGVIALAHAVNDSYGYVLPALLPVLIPQANLTLATGAALVAVQQLASSILQPFFGHRADRTGGGRWMSWVGVLLSGSGAALLGIAPSFGTLALAAMLLGIGTSLYHPVSAALVAQAAPPDQRGFWMSMYISAGNVGLGIGPFIVGTVLVRAGLHASWLLVIPAVAVAVLIRALAPSRPNVAPKAAASLSRLVREHWRLLVTLVSVVGLRSWATTALATFLPILAVQRGAQAAEAAQLVGTYLLAGACGGFVGGWAADRVGRDRVVIGSLLLSVPFGVYLGTLAQPGPAFWMAAAAGGFFLNGSWVSLTVRGQESIPGSISMMSGLMLGLSVGLGAVAVTPMGLIAERTGVGPVIACAACLALLGAFIMRFVPPAPASAAAG